MKTTKEQTTTRQPTEAALTAKAIRQELKSVFPKIKFKVTCENYSGGNSVDIEYTDGVSAQQVESIVLKYKTGHFDGTTDIYEYSNNREDIPQVKYVFVKRKFSIEFSLRAMKELCQRFGLEEQTDLSKSFDHFGKWTNFNQLIWREYQNFTIGEVA